SPYPVGAAGSSIIADVALQRALGEAAERYSALNAELYSDTFPLTFAEGAISDRLPRCDPRENCSSFFKHPDPDIPITHIMVRDLVNDRDVPLPAGYVLLGFTPQPPEPLPTLPISTGLAFHTDLHSAIWSGLCEVAERDAM